MKNIEKLYKGFEFYNREDNRCKIVDKHFDSYECIEESVDSPDGLAEIVNTRTVFYTASEMRTMLYAKYLEWEDSASLSLDNGHTYLIADDLKDNREEILSKWDEIVNLMDDEIREEVNSEMAPCDEIEFLAEYLRKASTDLIVG